MFARELASQLLDPTPISVSAINPGFCHSRLTRTFESNPVTNIVLNMMKMLMVCTTGMGVGSAISQSRTHVDPFWFA